MKYKLVIFDWDGTLMDSADHIVSCMKTAAQAIGLSITDEQAVRDIIGLSYGSALEQLIPGLTPNDTATVVEHYKKTFLATEHTSALFHGAKELVQELFNRQYYLAVATGKGRPGLDRALKQTALDNYFHTTRTACECESKPSPQMILEIMDTLKLKPHEVVMVGDTDHDIDMAHNAGVASVGVTYGAQQAQRIQRVNPSYIVNHISEIKALL